jgi:formate dehydrogenase maturation protein FdhE
VPRAGNKWDQRIDRARELADTYPFATEILRFYAKLTEFQKGMYLHYQSARGTGKGRGPASASALDAVDIELLTTRFGAFLAVIAHEAPGSLAEFARGLALRDPATWPSLLRESWPEGSVLPAEPGTAASGPQSSSATDSPRHFERFCTRSFLQPYAELLADSHGLAEAAVRRPACPYCGSPPLVGVLRQEGDGGKRSLICSFCRTEWDYLRLACPACGESNDKNLCVYTSERFAQVRIEACDTCRAYIKTVDLTREGRAVPEVDDLASLPLSLWADQSGYRKITPNFIGL